MRRKFWAFAVVWIISDPFVIGSDPVNVISTIKMDAVGS